MRWLDVSLELRDQGPAIAITRRESLPDHLSTLVAPRKPGDTGSRRSYDGVKGAAEREPKRISCIRRDGARRALLRASPSQPHRSTSKLGRSKFLRVEVPAPEFVPRRTGLQRGQEHHLDPTPGGTVRFTKGQLQGGRGLKLDRDPRTVELEFTLIGRVAGPLNSNAPTSLKRKKGRSVGRRPVRGRAGWLNSDRGALHPSIRQCLVRRGVGDADLNAHRLDDGAVSAPHPDRGLANRLRLLRAPSTVSEVPTEGLGTVACRLLERTTRVQIVRTRATLA